MSTERRPRINPFHDFQILPMGTFEDGYFKSKTNVLDWTSLSLVATGTALEMVNVVYGVDFYYVPLVMLGVGASIALGTLLGKIANSLDHGF